MSDTFQLYAQYYDLVYADKEYAAEADYIMSLFDRFGTTKPQSIIELGCGTAIHSTLLAQRGFNLHAIDLSADMLRLAEARVSQSAVSDKVSLAQGNVQNYRTDGPFDAALSLFHIASYQTDETSLADMLQTAKVHLPPEGLFIFDFWHAPAVLHQKPELRVKRVANNEISVVRIAEPVLDEASRTVDVNYQIFVRQIGEDSSQEINETHKMRYYDVSEIEAKLRANGFTCLHAEEWLTGAPPSKDSWGVCVVAQKSSD